MGFDKDSQFHKLVPNLVERGIMARKSDDSVYKVVEVIGTSGKSWDDAAKNAVKAAAGSLRDLRIAEIVKLDMTVKNGKVRAYRARVSLSFKYGS
jgi:flavin-binding protein dodecin